MTADDRQWRAIQLGPAAHRESSSSLLAATDTKLLVPPLLVLVSWGEPSAPAARLVRHSVTSLQR